MIVKVIALPLLVIQFSFSVAQNDSRTDVRFCCFWSNECEHEDSVQLHKLGNQSGLDSSLRGDIEVLRGNPCEKQINFILRHKKDWGFQAVGVVTFHQSTILDFDLTHV